MQVIDEGHYYRVDSIDGDLDQTILFVKRFRGDKNHAGTVNQELLRVLIDRVQFLNAELPWEGNVKIIKCLRMALVLHECRALERKTEKELIEPEKVRTAKDGHYKLTTP